MSDTASNTTEKSSDSESSPGPPIWLRRSFRRLSKSFGISLILHSLVVVLLSSWTIPLLSERIDDLLDFVPLDPKLEQFEELPLLNVELDLEVTEDESDSLSLDPVSAMDLEVESSSAFLLEEEVDAAAGSMELADFGSDFSLLSDFSQDVGMGGEGLEGRGLAARSTMLRRNGGTEASEIAVKESLDWIARHQYPDGTWNFDHQRGVCQGRCSDPGKSTKGVRAATGLALLTYLGAGQTHNSEGPYREVINRGAHALVNLMKVSKNGGSFYEPQGSMYSHGIASMAICEAYAMTGDPGLRGPAQLALNYISYAQDPQGGGWRYSPRQAGDTSVMGWQLMALKSGYMASLSVPDSTVEGARYFLDSVQKTGGEQYLYVAEAEKPRASNATSAIGLLCRMFLGWEQDNPVLERGVMRLAKKGPSKTDAYYNYYASQVMFQYTSGKGPVWKKWNEAMRGMLTASQAKEGHEKGSWSFNLDKNHNDRGGRLYSTALASMTLEVYYRYLPVYKTKAEADKKETRIKKR